MFGAYRCYSQIILTHGVFSCQLQSFKCSVPYIFYFTHFSSSKVEGILPVVDLAHSSLDAIRPLERCRQWRLSSCYAPEELECPVRVQITKGDALSDPNTRKDEVSVANIAKEELNIVPCRKQVPPWGIIDENRSFSVETVNMPPEVRNNLHRDYEPVTHFLEERDEDVLSNRILILSQKNKPRAALDYFISMHASGLKPNIDACNALITCLGKNRNIVHALHVFEFTQRNRIATSKTYSSILKSVSCIHGYSAVLKMFWQLDTSEARKDFDSEVYDTMIFAAGKKNDWVQAELLWRSMRENRIDEDPLTYHLLLSIFVRCRRNDLAYDVYVEVAQSGIKLAKEDMEPAMVVCAREDKVAAAMTVFQNLLNDGVKPNLFSCITLISSLCRNGKIKLIFQVYDLIKPLGCAETLRGILAALHRAGHHDVVLKLFMIIEKDRMSEMNVKLYNTALMSCRDVGLWDIAIEILWRMEASKVVMSTVSYNLVIGACENGGRTDAAVQVYKHMLRVKCIPDRYTYLTMIKCFTARSLWAEVVEILNAVPRESCFYNATIHGMSSNGDFQLAKKIYTGMRELNLQPDIRTRNIMFQIFCDLGPQKDANYPSKRRQ